MVEHIQQRGPLCCIGFVEFFDVFLQFYDLRL